MTMNEVNRLEIARKYYLDRQLTEDPPTGIYGVWCEPRGHINNPRWWNEKPMAYDDAVVVADAMSRANKEWHYTAKPVSMWVGVCKCA